MKTLHVGLADRGYDIHIGSGLLDTAGQAIAAVRRPGKAVVLTDDNVWPLYGTRLSAALGGLPYEVLVLPHGEQTKCAAVYAEVLSFCAAHSLTRSDLLIAFGGGVIGDLGGFVAATYMRGIDFVQIPTTLLAQVDSSVGGKTAIDLPEGKNLVGAFWQPILVLADTDLLQSLPTREQAGGLAEVIKYGAIFDQGLFALLEAHPNWEALTPLLDEVVYSCCDWKRQVVERDERDTGDRMLLNFGHTFGHAIEAHSQYTTYIHGEGVALGMVLAAKAGERLGYTPTGESSRLERLCASFGLPMSDRFTADQLTNHLKLDKKRAGATLRLILLHAIGKGFICPLAVEDVVSLTEALCHAD